MRLQILTLKEEPPYFNRKEKTAATIHDSIVDFPIGHKADEIRLDDIQLKNAKDCQKLIELIKNAQGCFIK